MTNNKLMKLLCLSAIVLPAYFQASAMGQTTTGGTQAFVSSAAAVDPSSLTVVYDPATGNVSATAPTGKPLTIMQLTSDTGQFSADQCLNTDGPFDLCGTAEVFKLDTDGFDSVDFGPVLPTNLSESDVLVDVRVNGATLGGGFDVGPSGPVLVVIPEPGSVLLLATGMLLIAFGRRR